LYYDQLIALRDNLSSKKRYHGLGKPVQNALYSIWGKNEPHPINPVDRPKFVKILKHTIMRL